MVGNERGHALEVTNGKIKLTILNKAKQKREAAHLTLVSSSVRSVPHPPVLLGPHLCYGSGPGPLSERASAVISFIYFTMYSPTRRKCNHNINHAHSV